jgi:phosphate transport system permease protein
VGLGDNVADPQGFRWATALVLLIVVLSFYAIGIATRYYFRSKLRYE